MIFSKDRPSDFHATIDVVTCFMEWDDRVLLLQYPEGHMFPKKWAVPGGRVEKGETKEQALERELFEELGLKAIDWRGVTFIQDAYVRRAIGDIRLHLFKWKLDTHLEVLINQKEHLSFCWQPIQKFKEIDLIDNQYDTFKVVYE